MARSSGVAIGDSGFDARMFFYHSAVFPYLIDKNREQIRQRLLQAPLALRATHCAPQLQAAGLDRNQIWTVLWDYLSQIEASLAAIIGRRSPVYWLHLYRRIAPTLAPEHEGKRDNVTVSLVRQIAELAIEKYGDLALEDVGSVGDTTTVEEFLGGHYLTATKKFLRSKPKAIAAFNKTKSGGEAVLLDFGEEDLASIFEIEGLSYEYWRTSAAMRAIGKGCLLKWDTNENWLVLAVRFPTVALEYFDARNAAAGGLHTSLGTWVDSFATSELEGMVFVAQYEPNAEVVQFGMWNDAYEGEIEGHARPNFSVGRASLQQFEVSHAFMADAFQKKHGLSLSAVIFCLSFVSSMAALPSRLFDPQQDSRTKEILASQRRTNLLLRGYAMSKMTVEDLADEAIARANGLSVQNIPARAEVLAGMNFLALSPSAQSRIGLWSGGKRPVLVPLGRGAFLTDLVAIGPFLHTLFFGVREITGAKGPSFEEAVRSRLKSVGANLVHVGELSWPNGTKREVDAAVRIHDRLIIVEAVSIEAPLDNELSKPSVHDDRQRRLTEKAEQAQSLALAIAQAPVGANFDFSWASKIDWRVVSPFVEYFWDGPLAADERGVPRVLEIGELAELVSSGRPPAYELLPQVRQARGLP